jgi:hypothetical protein
MKKISAIIGIVFLLLLTGCTLPFQKKSTPEGECGDLEQCEEISLEERVGSFTLKIERGIDAGITFVKCDGSMTVWFNTDPSNPALGYLTFSTTSGWNCLSQLGGTGNSGVTVITTCDVPVTYKVEGKFKPHPDCSLNLTITETMKHSQTNNCVNNILGPLPIDPTSLPQDSMTVFYDFQFIFPDTPRIVKTTNVFGTLTVSDVVVNKETGCSFSSE